jgi:hypothetical protein
MNTSPFDIIPLPTEFPLLPIKETTYTIIYATKYNIKLIAFSAQSSSSYQTGE